MELGRCVRIGLVAVLGLSAVTGCSNPGEQQLADLIGDPDATLEFFYPDGVVEPGTSPVAIDYIRDRKWSSDGFDTLAQVLDEAATAHRDADDPLSELSALAATDTINLLGERDDEIGEAAYDSLGHLLANYMVDVDIAAQPMPSTLAGPRPVLDDLPPGAAFQRTSLDLVMRQVLSSPDAFRDVTNSALGLNAYRIDAAIDNADPVELNWATLESKDLLQYVGITAGFRDLSEADERIRTMVELMAGSVEYQPAPGARFADYLSGAEPLTTTNLLPPYEDYSAVKDVGYALSVAIWDFTRLNAGIQLGRRGMLEDVDDGFSHESWFVDGKFSVELALNEPLFLEALTYQPDWHRALDRGYHRGRLSAEAREGTS